MKPKPRSATTFLITPVATVTSTFLEQGASGARSVREEVDHTAMPHSAAGP
jgi:hypothetical protein